MKKNNFELEEIKAITIFLNKICNKTSIICKNYNHCKNCPLFINHICVDATCNNLILNLNNMWEKMKNEK